jgi:hypothetical protein
MVHFRVSEPDLRIEVDAEVAWIDETRRMGGLRFTKLWPETRRQIHNWMTRSTAVRVDRSYAPVARHRSPTAGAAIPVASPRALAFFTNRLGGRLQGFSGGFATGLLLSALVGSSLLLHSRRRELGEVLVRWGERLGAEPPRARSVDTYTRSPQVQVEHSAASFEPDLQTQPGEQRSSSSGQ